MAAENEIEMQEVVSTRVKALGYDAETKTLRCEFPNGRVAEYSGVAEETFRAVMDHPESVGQAFGSLIVNGGYPFKYV